MSDEHIGLASTVTPLHLRKVDLWGSFVGRADMYMKDGLHLSVKGAAVFADKLSAAVDSDLGTMTNIFGSKHSLN